MHRIECGIGGLLLLGLSGAALAADNCHHAHVPGEVLVQTRGGDKVDSLGLKVQARKTLGQSGLELWRLAPASDARAAVKQLQADPRVAFAECNLIRPPLIRPDDPAFPRQWYLENLGQTLDHPFLGEISGTPGADMDGPAAWDITTGSREVVVAVVDDAVDLDHPDLSANIWRNPGETAGNGVDDDGNGFVDDVQGWDFAGNDNNPRPDGIGQGHGTTVAGVLGAVGDNGIGIAGTAWRVSIMPLKFRFDVASGIQAMDYAAANGAHIVNASFGGPGFSQAEADAVARLEQAGVLLVASAGNEHADNDILPLYPASFASPAVLSVAESGLEDQLLSASRYGQTSVDVAAPGVAIFTTTSPDTSQSSGDSGEAGLLYDFVGGTSFSAPGVAGIAALLKARFPDADRQVLRGRILAGAEPLSNQGVLATDGRADAFKALTVAPQPVLTVADLTLVDGDNHALDPGETLDLVLTLENAWLDAGPVTALLGSPDAHLQVLDDAAQLDALPGGQRRQVSFSLRLDEDFRGHRRFPLTLELNSSVGTTIRQLRLEVGVLPDDVRVQETIQADPQDDIQFYHVVVPADASRLTVAMGPAEGSDNSDLDLMLSFGEPPEFDPFCYFQGCLGQDVLLSAENDSRERIEVADPAAGTWYVAVVNYRSLVLGDTAPVDYRIEAVVGSGGGGGGGGSLGWWLPLGLLGLLALRRCSKPLR